MDALITSFIFEFIQSRVKMRALAHQFECMSREGFDIEAGELTPPDERLAVNEDGIRHPCRWH